ncbi:MAG: glycosyltransferase family 2 protein [Candidatus Nanoarchaeia archaeon]
MKFSVIIPAYNEGPTIGRIVSSSLRYVNEVVVVDDCSTDCTVNAALENGARVISNESRLGYSKSIEIGINNAVNSQVITMDGDGEHDPRDIEKFIEFYKNHNPNIIIGERDKLPRRMERVMSSFFYEFYNISDVFCGFRLIQKSLLKELENFSTGADYGLSFIIDAYNKGYKILNMHVDNSYRRKNPQIGVDSEVEKRLLGIFKKIIEKHFI